MRKNPFITIVLLILIEIVLFYIVDYTNLIEPSSKYSMLVIPLLLFSIPIISILISVFKKDISHKKQFRYFSIFLLITSVLLFIAWLYLLALAHAYQH